jgi:tetratricopeptide (TPR) repeat protein
MSPSVILRTFVLAILHVIFCTLGCKAQDGAGKLIRDAKDKAKQNDYSTALSDLQAATALEPGNPEAWYQLGLVQGQIGDFRAAESAFRQALKLKPEFPEAHYSLGLTFIANPQGKLDWPAANSEFREALQERPDYAEARNLLGAGLTAAGDIDAAIVQLQQATALEPSLPEAHFNLAIALEKSDQPDEAVKQYQAAVSTKGSSYPEASVALGKLFFRMGKTSQATQELENALVQNPDLADAHYVLARVLQASGKPDQAEVEFKVAQSLSQRLPDAMQSSLLSNQALELAAKGDFKAATDSLHKAIALKPDYGVPHYNLGLILADQGNLKDATNELTKAISLLPGRAKAWYQLGRVLARSGDKGNALLALSWAARLSPTDLSIRSELDSVRAGNRSESLLDNSQSVSAPPTPGLSSSSDTAADHLAFAGELDSRGDRLGSVGELLRSLALQPSNLDTRRQLAKTYAALEQNDRAILEYQKIVVASPNEVDSRVELGKIFLLQGNAKDAIQEFLTAQKIAPDSVPVRLALEQAQRAQTNR